MVILIYSAASNASGNFVGSAGIGTGSMGIVNAGLGYTPASGTNLFCRCWSY